MTTLTSGTPAGQLAAARPSRSRLFDRLGINGLLGRADAAGPGVLGARPGRGPPGARGRRRRANPDDRDDSAGAPMGELVDHIVPTHHDDLRRELPRLAELAEKVARVLGERHPERADLRTVFAAFREELALHMLKEE